MEQRDRAIVEFLSQFRCATSKQIAQLFWGGKLQPAQRRLLTLFRRKQVNRFLRHQVGIDEYVYTMSLQHKQQAEHYLEITQAYVDLAALPYRVEFKPHYFEEFHLRRNWRFTADALVTMSARGGKMVFFLEVERRPVVRQRYDKVKHYEAFFESGLWRHRGWSDGGKLFPAIVVAGTPARVQQVRRAVSRAKSRLHWLYKDDRHEWLPTLGVAAK